MSPIEMSRNAAQLICIDSSDSSFLCGYLVEIFTRKININRTKLERDAQRVAKRIKCIADFSL